MGRHALRHGGLFVFLRFQKTLQVSEYCLPRKIPRVSRYSVNRKKYPPLILAVAACQNGVVKTERSQNEMFKIFDCSKK